MSARDDLRAAVERLADELEGDSETLPIGQAVRALLAEHPAPEPPSKCDGSFMCGATLHEHGCYADEAGFCNHPEDHEPPSGGDCAFGGADDTNPSAGRAGEVTAEELDTAAYWQGRFLRMRAMYRERFNEGLSTEDWHRKHCGLMNAPEVTADELAAHLAMSYGSHVSPPHGGKDWRAADALLARYDVRRRP